ncbi:MAG: two-component regulator propeller domain-containing protein, partial [Rhodothermales bacterium]|nr:two-component regulator propeller domain-containing protein [Rhodothermales bacterium]
MLRKSIRIGLLLSLCLSTAATAQRLELTFGQVPLPGGAYGNYVTSIVQDDLGFMWIGTWGGLHRFDGYEVRSFVHVNDDPTSLSTTWVECLYVDKAGTLWVGTFGGGLNRFDPATETFTRYQRDPANPASLTDDVVTAILEDHTGTLWVGTHGGLNALDRNAGTFRRFRHDPSDSNTLSDDQVRALYEDRDGTLWVGTGSPSDPPYDQAGLNRFDRETRSFRAYFHEPGDPSSLIDSQVRAIMEDSDGRFWVGTWGDG